MAQITLVTVTPEQQAYINTLNSPFINIVTDRPLNEPGHIAALETFDDQEVIIHHITPSGEPLYFEALLFGLYQGWYTFDKSGYLVMFDEYGELTYVEDEPRPEAVELIERYLTL